MGRKLSLILLLVLGVVSLLMAGMEFLALTDIYHGTEPDLSTEWWMVSRGFLPIILFNILAIVFIGRRLLGSKG